ncbi:metallophosphoesterase [candidate division WOR-3 bacterium]|nr:metallophosphoesterase [candidate division WOR-3 bacterium]
MKIMALTDIHGRTGHSTEARDHLQHADLVLVAGDITNFGGWDDAKRVLGNIAALNKNILAVSGNCDRDEVRQALCTGQMDLHGVVRIIDGAMFYGVGGCNTTHFHTPQEYSEKEIAAILARFPDPSGARHTILVSHAPPHKTKLDRMFLGLHVGSKAIRTFIEDVQPDLVVCGHIHEARGDDRIGRTLILNPGQFPKHYALIEVDEGIGFTLY